MSQSSFTRWNSVSMSRAETSLKRSRSEEGEGYDDGDVSIASRTPSPPPPEAMDVDHDISKYDERLSGASREVVTVETKIKSTNKGFAMLAKLGWSEGQPLGISGDGRVDPIPFQIKRDLTGLGKTNQDFRMIETTVSQRRGLDSERQQKETENQRRAREDLVARKAALESEISTTLKAFYCTLCDKQFKTVAQYDEHTNSYAHHHKARFKDMQANVRLKPKEEMDKRKEKERKREEKELRKIAAANGIRMTKPTVVPVPADVSVPGTLTLINSNPAPGRPGWTTSSGDPGPSHAKSGWATIGSVSSPGPPAHSFTSLNPVQDSSPSINNQIKRSSDAPAFRTAGWTSLDAGGSRPASPFPLPGSLQAGGPWSSVAPHIEQADVSSPQQIAPVLR